MGLFKKVKDILFDEEEVTSQIKITPEMRNEDNVVSEKPKAKVEAPVQAKQEVVKPVQNTEKESYNNDSAFPFFDFDEKEFEEQKPVQRPHVKEQVRSEQVKRNPAVSNAFEYERKKKIEKRMDYGRYEKTEITETTERKKFKPSPIISPVYGILNQDYDKNDIIHKDTSRVDVQAARDKAFGEKKEEKISPKTTYYEETETVTVSRPEEHQRKVKTIDELLEETSDIVVDTRKTMSQEIPYDEVDAIDDEPTIETPEVKADDDTLENDLFDLIDSMYDSDEDGE